jgi:hypothetical protein
MRKFNPIEGAVMNGSAEKKYRKGYVLRFRLLSLTGAVLFFILFYTSTAQAIQVSLSWDPPATGTPDGYRLFYRLQGQSYNYSQPAWQGSTTTGTISSLQDTTTYFVVRAYNAAGESGDSNEAVYQPAATPAAAISRSPASLSASCIQGANAPSQSFQVSNSGGGTLSYTISDNQNWLSCSPASGTSTGESDTVTVSYNTSGLTAGTYNATITISASGASSQTIPVTLAVNAAAAAISRSPASLSASCTQGANAPSQSFQVSNSGGGTLSYSISDNQNWLSCSPASGTSTGESDSITVSYNTSGLTAGNATITITALGASNSPQTVPVTLTVNAPAPAISRSPASLSASCTQGTNAASQSFQVSNSGGGTLSYSISDNQTWLSCSPTSGSGSGTIAVSYNTSGLTAGTYNAAITITASGASNSPQTIPVSLTVVASNLPPQKPVITSPYNGQVECDPLLHVQTGPFSDPDSGDTHSKSRWQISSQADFSSLVLDISSNTCLTELPVPDSVLDRAATYYVRVQFFDAVSEASEWSDAVQFRTLTAVIDSNQNGIPDSEEVDATVDLNGDGIPDNNQPDLIKSAQTAVAKHVAVGVYKNSNAIVAIDTLDTVDSSTILDKKNKPKNFMYGLCSYRLKVSQPGSTVTVKVYYSSTISGARGYYLYDTINGWQDYGQYVTFNNDGRSVTVELQDGGYGDSDGVANGIIVDPGGVVADDSADSGSSASDPLQTGSQGDSNTGHSYSCFIATSTGQGPQGVHHLPLVAFVLIAVILFGCLLRSRR